MSLHNNFPKSPYAILQPGIRWFPAEEDLRDRGYEKLLPPLVAKLRTLVYEWRQSGYEGATDTSIALLKWWFKETHFVPQSDGTSKEFKYYFAQQEAVETIIYLTDVAKIKHPYDLLRYDSSGMVSTGMFEEDWCRFVIKMATGSGKTKVLSLIIAWAYFHKLYEVESTLARNFLLITPNIIVLDRIRSDFDGLKIFYNDPILPDDGYMGKDWNNDFQLTVHIQDDVHIVRKIGNLFITNIHRVYENNVNPPSFNDNDTSDYFLGSKPVTKTNESLVDLDQIVRDLDELIVLNDEAHHVHDPKLAWFKSIQDISNRLKQRGSILSLQIDVTATPRHNNGAIFVQTVSDYPLVEAIYQNVVKHPVCPDDASRAKLVEKQSSKYIEKYEDYIELGYQEWLKAYAEHEKLGKKAILFVMTDDTKNCDEVAQYLENRYPELKGAVLVIHTKDNGEISETVKGKNKEELEVLRKASNSIDGLESPYKAIVSVLMLKEGWDVKNVTNIVGLRAYSAKSNILPEQTLGRGLRRMYRSANEEVAEYVSVVGTNAFMDFVKSIEKEGVTLEKVAMGSGTNAKTPLVIEIDKENPRKNIEQLDIKIPLLTPRIYREFKNLSELDVKNFGNKKVTVKQFNAEEQREIIFEHIVKKGEENPIHHITKLDTSSTPDFTSAIGFFAQTIMKELRLYSGYDILYGKVKNFIANELFTTHVVLDDLNTLRNLSEIEVRSTIIETFKEHINKLTVLDKGEAEIKDYIKVSAVRPFVAKEQAYFVPQKSVFNRIIGDRGFELRFAEFLDGCPDIVSFVKNYLSLGFKIDYQNSDNSISDYYTDFVVKVSDYEIFFVETKGLEDVDALLKKKRLKQFCDDLNKTQKEVEYRCLYVTQSEFEKYKPQNFSEVVKLFES